MSAQSGLLVRGQAQVAFSKDPASKQKPNVTIVQPATPVTLTVLPRQVATATVAPNAPRVTIGRETEVVVKVARMYDFAGEFRVELVLPPGTQGLGAEPVTIPAGRDEAKLVLKAAPDAPTGTRGNLIVRATAPRASVTRTDSAPSFAVALPAAAPASSNAIAIACACPCRIVEPLPGWCRRG